MLNETYIPIKAIFACCRNFGIGFQNNLPNWKLKNDLKNFQKLTIGNGNNYVIMGRNTWISLKERPLAKRMNIVISGTYVPNDNTRNDENVIFVKTKEDAFSYINDNKCHDSVAWIIGGSQIYHLFLDNYDEIYMSITMEDFDCDVYLSEKMIECIQNSSWNVLKTYNREPGFDGYHFKQTVIVKK